MPKFYVINTTQGGSSLNSIVITNGRGISIYYNGVHYTTFSKLNGNYGRVQFANGGVHHDYYRYYTGYVFDDNKSYIFNVDIVSGNGGSDVYEYCNGFIADDVSESSYIDSYPLVNINGRFKVNRTSYSLSVSLSHVLVVCKLAIDSTQYYGFAINRTSVYLLTSNPSTTEPSNYSTKSFSSIANDSVIEFENSEVPDFILDYLNHQGDFLYDYNYIVHSYDGQIIASKNEVPEIKHIKFTTLSNVATLIITGTNDKDYELTWTISNPSDELQFLGLSFQKNAFSADIENGYDEDVSIEGNLELYETFVRKDGAIIVGSEIIEDAINNREQNVATKMAHFIVDKEIYVGYGDYTFIWEKTYSKSPSRTQSGAMGPLDGTSGIPTFITPHMTATYDIMPISDYRRLMKQALSKNEFTVKCYDPVYDEQTTNKMYFATLQTPKFFTRAESDGTVSLIGVMNYTVELIGTNNEL